MSTPTGPLTQGQWQTWASVEIATAYDLARRGSRLHSDLRSAGRALDVDGDPAWAQWHLIQAIPRITSEPIAEHVANALVYLGAASLHIKGTPAAR